MDNTEYGYLNDGSFLTIQGLMVTGLHLHGPELIIYAVMHGAGMPEGRYYSGGVSYLMEWTGLTGSEVIDALNVMLGKGITACKTYMENGDACARSCTA